MTSYQGICGGTGFGERFVERSSHMYTTDGRDDGSNNPIWESSQRTATLGVIARVAPQEKRRHVGAPGLSLSHPHLNPWRALSLPTRKGSNLAAPDMQQVKATTSHGTLRQKGLHIGTSMTRFEVTRAKPSHSSHLRLNPWRALSLPARKEQIVQPLVHT